MHKFQLVKKAEKNTAGAATVALQREQQVQAAQLSAAHPEASYSGVTKEKYGIQYAQPPRLGVIGNVRSDSGSAKNTARSNNESQVASRRMSGASIASMTSNASQSAPKYPTSPTNRPSYLYGAISPEDSKKFTAEIETRVLKELSSTTITRKSPTAMDGDKQAQALDRALSDSRSADPNDPAVSADGERAEATGTPRAEAGEETEVVLNYPVKLPEARFQMMELHNVLDNMLADVRRNQTVLAGAGGETVHSSLTSASMAAVVFGGASSSMAGGSVSAGTGAGTTGALTGAGAGGLGAADSLVTSATGGTARSLSTNVGGRGGGSTFINAGVGGTNPNLRCLDGSVSGLEERAKKFSFDLVLADLVNQALVKARLIRSHYRRHLNAVEGEYLARMERNSRALAIVQKKLQAHEVKAKAHNRRGRHLIEDAMHRGPVSGGYSSGGFGRNRVNRSGHVGECEEDLENPALILPEIASYLKTHEHDHDPDGPPRRRGPGAMNRLPQRVLSEDMQPGEDGPRFRLSSAADSEAGAADAAQGDGEPDVAELLAHQLKAERIASNKRLQELANQTSVLLRRIDVAVAANRKMEEELDDKDLEVEDLKERFVKLTEEREAEVAKLKSTIVSNQHAATQHMRELLNSIPLSQQPALAPGQSTAPASSASVATPMPPGSAGSSPNVLVRQSSKLRPDSPEGSVTAPSPGKTLSRQSMIRVVKSDGSSGGPTGSPLMRQSSRMGSILLSKK